MRLLRRMMLASLAVAGCLAAGSCSYQAPASSGSASGSSGPGSSASGPPAYVSKLGTGWKQTFDGTFTGSSLNRSVWGTCYPWQSPNGCTNFGNSNEYEWYTPSQDKVSGGALHLIPRQVPTSGKAANGSAKKYAFRSGMITSDPGYRYQYGYLQVTARIPYGKGLWPALWLLPVSGQWPPEIDLIEHYGNSVLSTQHLHSTNYPTQEAAEPTPSIPHGWHTFGLYWSKYQIAWYIDGQRVFDTTNGIPNQAMYFLANLAVYQQGQLGRDWNPATDSMAIKSVQVWQAKSYPSTGHPLLPG